MPEASETVDVDLKSQSDDARISAVISLLCARTAPAVPSEHALNVVIGIKRAQALLQSWQDSLVPAVNGEFSALTAAQPDLQRWRVDGALLSRYAPPKSWTFPAAVVQLETDLAQAKARAKADHSATSTPGILRPTTLLFKTELIND